MTEILGIAIPTAVLTALATALTNWGSLRTLVNGTVKRVARMETKLDTVSDDVSFLKGIHAQSVDKMKSKV